MVNYDSNYLRQLAGQEIANPALAQFQGAQAGNALYKITQGREADSVSAAAAGGDKNALARLYGLDFARAKGIEDTAFDRKRALASDARAEAASRRAEASAGREAAEFEWKKQAQRADEIARVVYSATTPEMFETAKRMLAARGVQGAENFKFEDREGLIQSALSLKDQAAAGKPIEVSAGASLMTPQGKVLGTAPEKSSAKAGVTDDELLAKSQDMLNTIDGVMKDPYRITGTGASSVVLNRIPGTGAYDFQARVDQLKGKAFLEAYQSLKGGGAITEVEGRKATDAIARLDTAQSEEAFAQAMKDLRGVVESGMNRLKMRRAGGGGQTASGTDPGALLAAGRKAIAGGKDPEAVRQKLISLGVDPAGL